MVQKFTDTEACICQWMCLLLDHLIKQLSFLASSNNISVHIRFDLERYLLIIHHFIADLSQIL